jgi:hypothetical protein
VFWDKIIQNLKEAVEINPIIAEQYNLGSLILK